VINITKKGRKMCRFSHFTPLFQPNVPELWIATRGNSAGVESFSVWILIC